MSRKLVVYLDSGANIHSRVEYEITVEQLNYTDKEWDELSEEEKEGIIKEIAFQRADWGWYEQAD